MNKVKFEVIYNNPSPVNKLMQCVDLFKPGEGIDCGLSQDIFTVTFKKGEVVNKQRIEKTKTNIRKAIEKLGGIVRGIRLIGKIKY